MIRNQVSNFHPGAKVDLTQSTWSSSNIKLEGLHSKPWCWRGTTKTHPSSNIIKSSSDFRQRPLESRRHLVKPSRTLHRAGSHNTTITRATSGQKPVLTQDDPGPFMASWEHLKTQELNQLTSWVHSCRSPQGVHSIQHTKVYKDNMKGTCQRLTLLC